MNIHYPPLFAGIIALLQFFSAQNIFAYTPPDACNDPIKISSVIITNSACGESSGVILMNLAGGNNGYSYSWNPNVSNSNVAVGLPAGAYKIHIQRLINPECTLDTTVIVNNSNGPAVQVEEIFPANCLAANGKVTLSPAILQYTWSNGETGAINDGLISGCYTVTATNPNTSCYSVLRICVPNVNPLISSYETLSLAKCGKPIGSVEVNVSGGSGQYSYSFGNSNIASNLSLGIYTFFIVDNVSGCLDTLMVTMTEGQVSGTIVITPFNIKCAGSGTGNVQFDVIPGDNFKLPYTFSLLDVDGNPQSPGNLPTGMYFLQIADADSCLLPAKIFEIKEPPPFSAQTSVKPKNCEEGGQIQLDLAGGNGRFIVDWHDLAGFDNPEDRLNLQAGFYSATVYDSLFCAYPIDSVLVSVYCNIPDTLTFIVPASTSGTICLTPPTGVDAADLTYQKVGQNIPIFGVWSLGTKGCATYIAGPVPAFGVDPICIAMLSPTSGLSDTICIKVNITSAPVETDSIYFAIQAGDSGIACGSIPSNFNNPTVSLLDGQGLGGASDAFGTYTIDPISACITFQSFGPTGYNVDNICVGACDNVLRQCKVICYFPTVLSPTDCLDGISLPDTFPVTTPDCISGATICVPIPYAQIENYFILDNGLPYSGGTFTECAPQAAVAYALNLFGGPFNLIEWTVNGQMFSSYFNDIYDLLALMNQFDPLPGWTLEKDSIIIGGNISHTYGALRIVTAQGLTIEAQPGQKIFATGTNMRFTVGNHLVIFRRVQTGCLDTMRVLVNCIDCPPIYNYSSDNQGNIVWNVSNCSSDTLFCTNILNQNLGEYSISDNSQPFQNFSLCGDNTALLLDTGFHAIRIFHNPSFCQYDARVYVLCTQNPTDLLAVPDDFFTLKNTPIQIDLLDNDIIRGVVGNKPGLSNLELTSSPPNGEAFLDDIFGIVVYTPNEDFCGTDTFSYRITDTAGQRSFALVTVRIVCDKVLVYNGISPNGDNRNDFWSIAGIEQFPDNEVQVFNRWGNLVFKQKNYSNLSPWDGRWNGKDLPDGTYFYVIDLADGSKPLSGYLQILR